MTQPALFFQAELVAIDVQLTRVVVFFSLFSCFFFQAVTVKA